MDFQTESPQVFGSWKSNEKLIILTRCCDILWTVRL